MVEKNRVRNLSTRWLFPFKVVVFTVYTLLCAAIAYSFLSDAHNIVDWILGMGMAGIYFYFFIRLMKITAKLYVIEFDEQFLYVILKDQDMVIPLENIEFVEVLTLGGVYKIKLYHAEQLGDTLYFKLSLWYPLNYRIKDAYVNLLRKTIEKAKARKQEYHSNRLRS